MKICPESVTASRRRPELALSKAEGYLSASMGNDQFHGVLPIGNVLEYSAPFRKLIHIYFQEVAKILQQPS
jgi:hypothetical protein